MKHFVERAIYKIFKTIIFPQLIKKSGKAFFIGSPEHGNLGDQMIAVATAEFLKKSGINYIEIPYSLFYKFEDKIIDDENNLILLQGGGNFGNEYKGDDDVRLDVVSKYQKSKIVIMPQTMYYTKNQEGEERLKQTKDIFSRHKNLIICAREEISYQMMKANFVQNKVILVPDIVLSSKIYNKKNVKKKYVLFLIRKDREKIDNEKGLKEIESWCKSSGYKIIYDDTVKKLNFNLINRRQNLKKLFKKIRLSCFVVTDRLHGMIFSYINNVPVIVFPNYNHKIVSSYEWIKDGKVEMFRSGLDIMSFIKGAELQNNKSLRNEFLALEKMIKDK